MILIRTLLVLFLASVPAFAADARRVVWKKVSAEDYSPDQIAAAGRLALYAMFANNSYVETSKRPHFELPHGWSLNESLGVDDKKSGLHYEVWEHRALRLFVDEVVVAFRGTEDARDWEHGNLGSKQYGLLDATFPCVLANYYLARITAVGHSLGGGLALHCSLKRPGVSAFGFNPSTHVHQRHKLLENPREIAEERGDPLAVQRKVRGCLPNVRRWKYDFVRGADHISYPLAAGLLTLGATSDARLASLLAAQKAKGLPLPPAPEHCVEGTAR